MEVVGFCLLKKLTKTGVSPISMDEFNGKIVRVLEFADHSKSVLVLNNKNTGIATFDYSDVDKSFKCSVCAGVICPPHLDLLDRMAFATKTMNRKGGYPKIVADMVIANSLRLNEFNDDFIWQVQREEESKNK